MFDLTKEEQYRANREASLKKRLETAHSAPAPRKEIEVERNRYPRRDNRNTQNRTPATREPREDRRQETSASSDLRQQLFEEVKANHRTVLSYRDARVVIMQTLDFHKDEKGTYVWDKYCQQAFPLREGEMPSPNDLNIEHTWPQSRFSSRYAGQSKSDLHHLFPTDSKANGYRGHLEFGTVVHEMKQMPCPGIKMGTNAHGDVVFEGPKAHRGDMARAIFYFAVRYEMHLSADEEATLRAWHAEDPVSEEEMRRNDMIEDIQGNRNPFIDHPEYVEQISRF